jgi:opacity protein-like surface antigen
MKKVFIFSFILMSYVTVMNAQFSQVHVGLALPQGDFGEYNTKSSSNNPQGVAGTGFNIGYKYYNPLSTPNLSFVFGIDVFYNGLNSDYKDDVTEGYDEYVEAGYIEDYEYTFPAYINIPVTVGANYTYPINEKIKIYGELGLGANYSKVTSEKSSYTDSNGDEEEDEYKLDAAIGFTYGLEAGLFINNKFTIGLRYNNLGSYNYKDEDGDKVYGKKSLTISNLSLSVGYLF